MAANLQFSLVLSNDASQASIFHVVGESQAEMSADATAVLNVSLDKFNKLLVFASDWTDGLTGSALGEGGSGSANDNGEPLVALRLDLAATELNNLDANLKTPLNGALPSAVTFKDDAGNDVVALAKWFGDFSSIDGMTFTDSIIDNGVLESGAVARITQGDVTGPVLGAAIGVAALLVACRRPV